MAAPSYACTIARLAEMLGQDEDLLADLAIDLEPEDGCLWIHDTDDRSTLAFAAQGVDSVRELLADPKR